MSDAPSPPSISQAAFASELVKLLLQVAWADHGVAPAEAETLLAFARRSGLPEGELSSLQAMLTGQAPLVPPNLGLLKQRRTDALRAVKELLLSDREVTEEEEEVLSQIAALLG
jgi:uncharacterized tellurite resistance protein B-like protein